MKFLHLADLHLGKTVNEISMIEDQQDMLLKKIVPMAKEQGADAVLVAGDVYDKRVPTEAAVELLDDFLAALAALSVSVFLISGNHDSDERLNFGSRLFRAKGIYIAGTYEGEIPHETLMDAHGPVHVWMLPFVKSSTVRHFHPEEEIESYEAAVAAALRHAQIPWEERNVLLAHQFVAGGRDPELAGSELSAAHVGTVERVGCAVFDGFDYVALGHIHRPQRMERETLRYAGSPLKYSLREIGDMKTAPLVTLGSKGDVQVELLPLSPLREMRHIKGPLAELVNPAHLESPEDYIYATLTDEGTIPDAMAHLRHAYPNAMKLDYENSHTRALRRQAILADMEEKSFEEILREFYGQQIGGEPSPEEWGILMDAAREAGVTG